MEEPVPSPCIKICILDENQVCTGCRRTIDEIAGWIEMTDEEKQTILTRLTNLNTKD